MNGLQEHLDHEMGRGTDLQNAYAVSRMENPRIDDTVLIHAALKEGKAVLVDEWVSYCPRTDAILWTNIKAVAIIDDIEAAKTAEVWGEEEDRRYLLLPTDNEEEPAPSMDDEDLPF